MVTALPAENWQIEEGRDPHYADGWPKFDGANYKRVYTEVGGLIVELRNQDPFYISGHGSDYYHLIIRRNDQSQEPVACTGMSPLAMKAFHFVYDEEEERNGEEVDISAVEGELMKLVWQHGRTPAQRDQIPFLSKEKLPKPVDDEQVQMLLDAGFKIVGEEVGPRIAFVNVEYPEGWSVWPSPERNDECYIIDPKGELFARTEYILTATDARCLIHFSNAYGS